MMSVQTSCMNIWSIGCKNQKLRLSATDEARGSPHGVEAESQDPLERSFIARGGEFSSMIEARIMRRAQLQ